MLNYIWPIALIVISNVAYQICAKATPDSMNPMASLTVTYAVGAIVSAILYFVLNKNANLIREYSNISAAPIIFGIAIVGLEVGWIYAYRAGWQLSTASIVQSAFLAVALLFIGGLVYKEALNRYKIAGVIICLIGLAFINHK